MGVSCSGCCNRDSRDAFSREVHPSGSLPMDAGHPKSRSRDHLGEYQATALGADVYEGFGGFPSTSSKDDIKFKEHIFKTPEHNSPRLAAGGYNSTAPAAGCNSTAPATHPSQGSEAVSPELFVEAKVETSKVVSFDVTPSKLEAEDIDNVDADGFLNTPETNKAGSGPSSASDEYSSKEFSSPADSAGDGKSGGKRKSKWRQSFSATLKAGRKSITGSSGGDDEGSKKGGLLGGIRKSIARRSGHKKHTPNLAPDGRVKIKSGNANEPLSYEWLDGPLRGIAKNEAHQLGCKDAATNQAFTPLFFVIGGCPNYFCGMQVIAYFTSENGDGEVDFWWVKPSKDDSTVTEQETLCRQNKGPHKNDPGRSKPFYKPLADMFQTAHVASDGRRYAIEAPPGEKSSRAFIEEENTTTSQREKLWLTLVWQEDWTSSPFARSKYIKGKIVYQRNYKELEFYSREYMIKDGVMTFSDFEDPPFLLKMLPDNDIKDLFEGAT